jgi:hypothetical protein
LKLNEGEDADQYDDGRAADVWRNAFGGTVDEADA